MEDELNLKYSVIFNLSLRLERKDDRIENLNRVIEELREVNQKMDSQV